MDIEELLKEGPSLTLTPEAAPELPAEEKKAERYPLKAAPDVPLTSHRSGRCFPPLYYSGVSMSALLMPFS